MLRTARYALQGLLLIGFILLVYFLLPPFQWKLVFEVIQKCDWMWLTLLGFSVFVMWGLRVQLTWILLQRFSPQHSWALHFDIGMASVLWNRLIPFRGGSLIRWVILSKKSKVSKTKCLATLLVASAAELVVLLMALTIVLALAADTVVDWPAWASISFLVTIVGFGILFLFSSSWHQAELLNRWPLFPDLLRSLDFLKRPGILASCLIVIFFIWGLQVLAYYLMGLAIDMPLSWVDMFLIMCLVNFSMLIPITPANIGPLQFIITTFLVLKGYDFESALAYSLVFHAVHLLCIFFFGSLSSFRLGLNFASVRKIQERYSTAGSS